MTNKTKAKIEALEKEVKRLNFIIKNGSEDKTCIDRNFDCFCGCICLTISYINPMTREVVYFDGQYMMARKPEAIVLKDDAYKAIIKIKDIATTWYKLDKISGDLIDIPEPAEFAEKNEVTNDDGPKESN